MEGNQESQGNKGFMAEPIGGATGSEKIATMWSPWKNYYDNVLNSCVGFTAKTFALECVEKVLLGGDYLFTVEDIMEVVTHLEKDGPVTCDQLQAEHL